MERRERSNTHLQPTVSFLSLTLGIKLAPDEIKLIMFLIVEIKPFKYIGDKSLSQTKKWELIRTRYYDAKANNKDVEVIVPTV